MKSNFLLNAILSVIGILLLLIPPSSAQVLSEITKDQKGITIPPARLQQVAMSCDDSAYNQEFDQNNFNTARTSDRTAGFEVADNFTLTEKRDVVSVCFWGIYVDFTPFAACGPAIGNGDDAFEISYYIDNSGVPGALFAGPFSVSHTRSPIGVPFAFTEIFNYEVSHPPVTLEAAVKYWISITNDGPGDCFWLWVDNTAAPNDDRAYQFGASPPVVTSDQTFNLGGTIFADANVPTLGEWGLIFLCLLMIILGTVAIQHKKSFR